MSTVTITGFQLGTGEWHWGGSTATLRLYSNCDWVDSLGVPHVHGTIGSSTGFYQEIDLTIASGTVSVPTFTTPSTSDAMSPPDASRILITGVLFDSKNARREILFSQWQIPATTPTTFAALVILNGAKTLPQAPDYYLNSAGVLSLIAIAQGTLNDASEVVKGRTYLSLAAALAVSPIAVGDNDPRVTWTINLAAAPYNMSPANTAAQNWTALTAAITAGNALGASVGGVRYYLPAGIYDVALNTGNFSPSGTFMFEGAGMGVSVLRFPSGATISPTFFYIGEDARATFRNIEVRGYNTGPTTAAHRITGFWHQGQSVAGVPLGLLELDHVKINEVNTATKVDNGGTDIVFKNCVFDTFRGAGHISASSTGFDIGSILVEGCVMKNMGGLTGVGSSTSEFIETDMPKRFCVVDNNEFVEGEGFALATRTGSRTTTDLSYIAFTNNRVKGSATLGGVQFASGVSQTSSTVVSGNFFDVTGNGIQAADANISITDNTFEGTGAAVTVSSVRPSYGTIIGNKFYNDGGSVVFNDAAQRGWILKGNIHNRRSASTSSPYVAATGVTELQISDIFYSQGENSVLIHSGANKIDLSGSSFIGTAGNPVAVSITSTAGSGGVLTDTGGGKISFAGTGFSVVVDTVTGAVFTNVLDNSANGLSFSSGGKASINRPPGEGAALTVSSNTITPTHLIHQVGAGLIKTITVPAGFLSGSIALVPTAAFTYDATGNVLGTGTAVVDRTMIATLSSSTGKWSMSY